MLNRSLLLAFTLLGISASAQVRPIQHPKQQDADSIEIYEKQIGKIYKDAWDSLRKSEKVTVARNNINRLLSNSNSYGGFTVFTTLQDANFNSFNADNAPGGFSPINGKTSQIGIGFSAESRYRVVFDFLLASFGLSKTTRSGDQSIKFMGGSLLSLSLGYDCLPSPKFNLYPYLGFLIRMESLQYNRPSQTNPNYTGIWNILINKVDINQTSTRPAWQTGIGFDWVISENKKTKGGIILFTRAGTEKAFGTQKFKIDGFSYRPDIRQGDWTFTFGFKFFGRI